MACFGLTAIGFSDVQGKDFTEKCPETCGLCVKDSSKKCGEDDESYRDKFQNGCKAYSGIKCTDSTAIMGLDENEVKELLSRCPGTCDQCFEDINTVDFFTKVSTSSPTFEISSLPSHAPSSIAPNCFDDPAFRTIEYKLTCEMFSGAQSCDDLRVLGLDKKEIERVKKGCRKTCLICETPLPIFVLSKVIDETLNTSDTNSKRKNIKNMVPSLSPIFDTPNSTSLKLLSSPSSIVSNCLDDPAFRTVEYKLSCAMFSGAKSCDDLDALGLDRKEIERVKVGCRRTCQTCEATRHRFVRTKAFITKYAKTQPSPSSTVATSDIIPGSLIKTCIDDPNYAVISPNRFACFLHQHIECAKAGKLWGYTSSQVSALIKSCPESCRICADQLLPTSPTERGSTIVSNALSKNPSKLPAEMSSGTPSTVPSDHSAGSLCIDNLNWRNRFGLVCLDFKDVVCRNMHIVGFSAFEIMNLMDNCPEMCRFCSRPSFAPSITPPISPSVPPSSSNMQSEAPKLGPSVHPSPLPPHIFLHQFTLYVSGLRRSKVEDEVYASDKIQTIMTDFVNKSFAGKEFTGPKPKSVMVHLGDVRSAKKPSVHTLYYFDIELIFSSGTDDMIRLEDLRKFIIGLDTTYLKLKIKKINKRFFSGVSIIEIHDIQAPSSVPSRKPSISPTGMPNSSPSKRPSYLPSTTLSKIPSLFPSSIPSTLPTAHPSTKPTNLPTDLPSLQSSDSPSALRSDLPSRFPSGLPTLMPTSTPSKVPSVYPSMLFSFTPSESPSAEPSIVLSSNPSSTPSITLSTTPSTPPSHSPSIIPSTNPSNIPTSLPSSLPSTIPNHSPSLSPSRLPTSVPSLFPVMSPTSFPSTIPSSFPSISPSLLPSQSPSFNPTVSP
eukprot:CAMPEP_0194299940 /NCGR_PEP_ID=MMETSP0169-20130528/60984_1 /TAXON_ID=218684 /ORGANISM="Corethron pennatum, Strain L29A3" /LENGTH=884 /DNA_ID=CAMNT_0039050065 /DNA_START=299 /DNA_END=2950 /DNA_ORIENTATION=+